MSDKQTSLAQRLHETAAAVEAGKYGTGDDVDLDAVNDDLDEIFDEL